MLEKVEEQVQHDLVPLLPVPASQGADQKGKAVGQSSPVEALAEALVEGLVKAEAEAVKLAQEEIAAKEKQQQKHEEG